MTENKSTKDLETLTEIISLAIPNKLKAFYMTGSYAGNYMVNTSDFDGIIVLKDSSTPKDILKVEKILEHLSNISNKAFDIGVLKESNIISPKTPRDNIDALIIQKNSTLIYGKDIKPNIPEIDFKYYFTARINEPIYFIKRVRNVKVLKYPVDLPKPNDFYYGYCKRKLILNDKEVFSSKELVVNIGWIATALIALKAGEMVIRKDECLNKYKQFIGDEWCSFLEDIFLICRNKWQYLLPKNKNDQDKLKSLCLKALDFENMFLETYKDFLIKKLDESDEERLFVINNLLKHIYYNDDILLKKLKLLTNSENKEIRENLNDLFNKYKIKAIS